jgi:hypothetical protein
VKIYQSKHDKLPGTSYEELVKAARKIYHDIEKKSKRTPYIKTNNHSYFAGRKVFLNMFFVHLNQKSRIDRKRRLRFFSLGLDLVKNTKFEPIIKQNPNAKSETLYRFGGISSDGELFYVQLKGNKRGNIYLMSVYPPQ